LQVASYKFGKRSKCCIVGHIDWMTGRQADRKTGSPQESLIKNNWRIG